MHFLSSVEIPVRSAALLLLSSVALHGWGLYGMCVCDDPSRQRERERVEENWNVEIFNVMMLLMHLCCICSSFCTSHTHATHNIRTSALVNRAGFMEYVLNRNMQRVTPTEAELKYRIVKNICAHPLFINNQFINKRLRQRCELLVKRGLYTHQTRLQKK